MQAPEDPAKQGRFYLPEENLLPLRQKLYIKAMPDRSAPRLAVSVSWLMRPSIQNARPRTDLDAEVLKSGMVRRHIPVFNAQGQEIQVSEAILKNFDVVSVQLTVCSACSFLRACV